MKKATKKGFGFLGMTVIIVFIITVGVSIGDRSEVSVPENAIAKVIIPIQKSFYKTGQFFENHISILFNLKKITKENELVKNENIKLKQELIQVYLKRNEYDELKELYLSLNYVINSDKNKYVTASVTGKDMGNWFNIFTIDAGNNQGIIKNSTVINSYGLVGKVFDVGDDWAKVITIIDNKSSVSFEILRKNQYIGVVRGSVKGDLNGYLIDPEVEVIEGDKLITSGLSLYPKGILIGKIKAVKKEKDELLKNIIVEPAVNFKKINKVMIIVPDKVF